MCSSSVVFYVSGSLVCLAYCFVYQSMRSYESQLCISCQCGSVLRYIHNTLHYSSVLTAKAIPFEMLYPLPNHHPNSAHSTLTLSLPRVINFKFLLQPHHKCYTTQYEELGFSSLTQMKDDYTINSHYLTYTFSL